MVEGSARDQGCTNSVVLANGCLTRDRKYNFFSAGLRAIEPIKDAKGIASPKCFRPFKMAKRQGRWAWVSVSVSLTGGYCRISMDCKLRHDKKTLQKEKSII